MKISIIHPSRGRPEQAYKTAMNWLEKRQHKVEYILVIDSDDPLKHEYFAIFNGSVPKIFECVNQNNSCITAINYGATIVSGGIFIVVSDDFDCPQHWDTLLLEAIGDQIDFCAKTIDGHQDWLITLPVMDRVYYERFEYIYNPEYKHMHADLDMTCTAWMLDRYIHIPLEFKHNHYSLTGSEPDEINKRNNATWGQGKVLFNQRLARNFDLTGELKELPKLPRY